MEQEYVNKHSYDRYDKCKNCRHENKGCDCTLVNPITVSNGLFVSSLIYYSPDYEPKIVTQSVDYATGKG